MGLFSNSTLSLYFCKILDMHIVITKTSKIFVYLSKIPSYLIASLFHSSIRKAGKLKCKQPTLVIPIWGNFSNNFSILINRYDCRKVLSAFFSGVVTINWPVTGQK